MRTPTRLRFFIHFSFPPRVDLLDNALKFKLNGEPWHT